MRKSLGTQKIPAAILNAATKIYSSYMQINKASQQKRDQIIHLLQVNKLPTEDLPSNLENFYTADDDGTTVGVIGMERYGSYGLLRSMVIHGDYRNRNIAQTLITVLEKHAAEMGISDMYLLTETADKYFDKKGYKKIEREEVPLEVQRSSEFGHVCPASATVMTKHFDKV
jgi:amino-acid N-acetyltransferase